jgi:RNA polymerase sigma-70 factor, ECF subfamily
MIDGDRVGSDERRRAAVLAGDERAWREWYDTTYDHLRAYAHWRCAGLRDLADEVVQETWLVAVRRIRTFDPRQGSFRSWLFGIAGNVVRDSLRVLAARKRRMGPSSGGAHVVKEAADAAAERAEQIARTLAGLAPRHEQVLRAKYLEQMSVQAIAELWGETPKAVESLLTRARQAFREAYDAGGSGGRP